AGRLARRRALPASMHGAERSRPGVLTRLAGSLALPPAPSVGLRFAIRNDRNAPGVPVWTTIVGATVTVGLLVATLSFTASLRHVIDTPHDYGWNWDLRVGAPALPDIGGSIVPALSRDKAIVGLSAGTVTQALVHGQRFDILALQRNEGVVEPTFIAGR